MADPASRIAHLSIRWRLTGLITTAFVLTIAAIFLTLRPVISELLYSDLRTDLEESLGRLKGSIGVAGATEPESLGPVAGTFPYPAVIRDANGNVLAGNELADARAMSLSESEVVAVTVEGESLDRDESLRGQPYRVRSERLRIADTILIVQVGRSTQSIDHVLTALNRVLLIGGAVAAVFVLAVSYLLASGALRPVEKITHLAAQIEASDLTQRISAANEPSETQRLADTFDAMLARLESAFAQQRNFVMDVSHELRTPLTALRGNLDVLLMSKNLSREDRVVLERMSQEVGRLIRLTSNLLYLAHAEAGRDIVRRPIELDALCLEVVHQASALRDDVAVRLDHESQLTVYGDPDLLKQLLLNLLDNAIKYSPPAGNVNVSLYEREEVAEIVVADEGPGIPEEQISKIFERFYRSSDQHTRTVGGAGIGLAISRWIAHVHGGDIRVESRAGDGSRFIVTLPLSAEEPKVPVS